MEGDKKKGGGGLELGGHYYEGVQIEREKKRKKRKGKKTKGNNNMTNVGIEGVMRLVVTVLPCCVGLFCHWGGNSEAAALLYLWTGLIFLLGCVMDFAFGPFLTMIDATMDTIEIIITDSINALLKWFFENVIAPMH